MVRIRPPPPRIKILRSLRFFGFGHVVFGRHTGAFPLRSKVRPLHRDESRGHWARRRPGVSFSVLRWYGGLCLGPRNSAHRAGRALKRPAPGHRPRHAVVADNQGRADRRHALAGRLLSGADFWPAALAPRLPRIRGHTISSVGAAAHRKMLRSFDWLPYAVAPPRRRYKM
jgi:hypothetical protein